jgi:O-antigen ligase
MAQRDLQNRVQRGPGRLPPAEVPQYSYSWLPYLLCGLLALLLAFVITRLNYGHGQAPHRIIKMIVGVAFVAFTVLRPKLALHLWILAMPVAAWLPVTGIPGLNGVNLLFVVAVLGWVMPWLTNREPLLPPARITAPLVLYIVVLFASAFRTILFPPEGTSYAASDLLLRVWQRVPALGIYFVVLGSVRTEKRMKALMNTFALSMIVAALIAVRQFIATPEESARRIGAGMNPNDFAAYVAMCGTALLAYVFYSGAFRGLKRAIIWTGAALASIAVLLPKSRGGYLGFAGGLAALTYLFSRKAFFVFLIIMLASPLWVPGFVKERVMETEVDSVEAQIAGDVTDRLDPSAAVRIDIWGIVIREVAHRPFFGYGFGAVPRLTVGEIGRPFSAHSLYFETLGDMGLIGFAALLWLLVACVRSGFDLMRRATTPMSKGLSIGFIAASVVMLLTNVFGQRFLHRSIAGSYFLLAGLVDRSILMERRAASTEE